MTPTKSVEVTPISQAEIDDNRMTYEQIIAAFPSYEAGIPSNVLYLKNLGKQVNEADIAGIFTRFQDNTLSLKLMNSGKMKGQAFITFQGSEAASLALQSVNGFVFKGKPIIISYGKKKTNEEQDLREVV